MGSPNCQIAKLGGEYAVPKYEIAKGSGPAAWQTSDGTDFTIWFSPRKCPLAGGNTFESTNGTLAVQLSENAEPGTYEYTVHCHGNEHHARGLNSPPVMIVI